MPVVSRSVIYSLIAVVLVLLLGIAALLSVSYQRHQRLEDATIDFQRNLTQKESRIVDLQAKLANCDTVQTNAPIDTSWSTAASAKESDSTQTTSQSPPKW
ncbi:hypothetical protein GO730_16685 [Spirosoma sp. HMF3257]|uniref:Uncharacterized protein n=1 Tax=Spirosoma telluris TaxID=2183553 RepID=A0A327NVP7_9BACT|nr:hypothetical protein [Spirosoma telluris]RAI78479.1 hypothetical protein HMF3257_16620 [Spirosoma telluris]